MALGKSRCWHPTEYEREGLLESCPKRGTGKGSRMFLKLTGFSLDENDILDMVYYTMHVWLYCKYT